MKRHSNMINLTAMDLTSPSYPKILLINDGVKVMMQYYLQSSSNYECEKSLSAALDSIFLSTSLTEEFNVNPFTTVLVVDSSTTSKSINKFLNVNYHVVDISALDLVKQFNSINEYIDSLSFPQHDFAKLVKFALFTIGTRVVPSGLSADSLTYSEYQSLNFVQLIKKIIKERAFEIAKDGVTVHISLKNNGIIKLDAENYAKISNITDFIDRFMTDILDRIIS